MLPDLSTPPSNFPWNLTSKRNFSRFRSPRPIFKFSSPPPSLLLLIVPSMVMPVPHTCSQPGSSGQPSPAQGGTPALKPTWLALGQPSSAYRSTVFASRASYCTPASPVRALSLLCSVYSGLAGFRLQKNGRRYHGQDDLLVGEEAAAKKGACFSWDPHALFPKVVQTILGKKRRGALKGSAAGCGLKELKSLQAFEGTAVILIAPPPQCIIKKNNRSHVLPPIDSCSPWRFKTRQSHLAPDFGVGRLKVVSQHLI